MFDRPTGCTRAIRGFNCSRPLKKSDLTLIQQLNAGTPPEPGRNSGGIPPEFGRNLAGTSPEFSAHPGGTRFCDRQAPPGTFLSEFRAHSAYSAKIPRPSAVKKIAA
jgi:hypothetical protein